MNTPWTRVRRALGWAAIAVLLAGRAGANPAEIVIQGSNTFGEELAPKLIAEYRKAHTGVAVVLGTQGSNLGIEALLAGECDLASSSRHASEDELRRARSRGIALQGEVIGYYGVAVIVNEASPLDRLNDTEVRDIFTGARKRWDGPGGSGRPIHLYIRDPASGTYLGFQELAMERRPYDPGARKFFNYAEIAEAVAGDPDGIGYVSMALTGYPRVRALRINQVPPTVLTVDGGDYPYSRTLRLYYIAGKRSAAAADFVAFVVSKAGQDILSDLGFVPRYGPMLPAGIDMD